MEEKYFYLFFFKQCETILYTFINNYMHNLQNIITKKETKEKKT